MTTILSKKTSFLFLMYRICFRRIYDIYLKFNLLIFASLLKNSILQQTVVNSTTNLKNLGLSMILQFLSAPTLNQSSLISHPKHKESAHFSLLPIPKEISSNHYQVPPGLLPSSIILLASCGPFSTQYTIHKVTSLPCYKPSSGFYCTQNKTQISYSDSQSSSLPLITLDSSLAPNMLPATFPKHFHLILT